MLAVYILEGTEPVRLDLCDPEQLGRLERWLAAGHHVLEQTALGTAWVSTVFLPCRGSSLLVDSHGRPLLFETLIETTAAGDLDSRTYHYGTYRLALSGHRHLVRYLRRRLLA